MPKYEYNSEFEVSGSADQSLPVLGTSSLQEALDYLDTAKGGTLVTWVSVVKSNGKQVTVVSLLDYHDVKGKTENEVFALLDNDVDGRLRILTIVEQRTSQDSYGQNCQPQL